ncbi:MAG: FAD-dependent oxidoreductase [Pseudomonadota bacterium]
MHPIIIIGSGLAGYNTAKELRKLDKETPLIVISADSGQFYSKPMLSNALASNKLPEAIALSSAGQMAIQINAAVRPRTRVTAVGTDTHQVCIGDETVTYSKLVLALGAEQIRLPLEGDAAAGVLSVNDLDDYTAFRAAIRDGKSVVLIGAGLIGCEFANDLSTAGHKVDVVDIATQPLPRLLPPEGGALLRQKLAALGVTWHFGNGVQAVNRTGTQLRVTLTNGQEIVADVVLSAVGLKPNTQLARAAGLKVNRGIVVDRKLATSAEDVYALGDCAEVGGLVLPFVMPIMHAARALAATLSGKTTVVSYPAMPVLVKTPACPTIISPPANGAVGEWKIEQGSDSVKSLFVDSSGKLLGFALNGAATAERAKLAPQLPPVLA